MDKQYSWKRTDEIEIDLADLLYRLCGQWKKIAVCALVSAVILAGYGWLRNRNIQDVPEEVSEEGTVLTETEEQGVADAVRLESEIKDMEAYLDSSVLMQLDPYHKNRAVMLYSIKCSESQKLQTVTESYLNFLQNGGAADALLESGRGWNMDKSCLAELISAYQRSYSMPYQIMADDIENSGGSFHTLIYVEVTGKSAEMAEEMALDVQDILKKQASRVSETTGSHELRFVSSAESMTADSGLQSQQHDKRSLLASYKASLKAMTDAFSSGQMAAYRKAAGAEEGVQPEQEPADGAVEKTGGTGISIRYLFIGFIGGAFAYCCIFACRYLFCDTVKSTEEMKKAYAFPVYGCAASKGSKEETQALNRLKLACKKQGVAKIYAAADFSLDAQEKESLQDMAGQLKNWEIEMTVAENAAADTDLWDSMAQTGHVLLVCRIGTTTHRMIDDAMRFYLENGIAVTGAAVFPQNRKNRTRL